EGSCYDYVEVKAVNRSDDPMLNCTDSALIQLDTTETTFDLYNAGPETGTVSYRVVSDGEWLEITPSEGSFNVSEKLTLKVREGYQDTWRRTKMTVDAGDAGVKVVDVMYQGGNIIFAENFNDMEDGSIVGQRGWTLDVGKVVVTNAYECDGKCMFHYISGGNDACSMYLPKPWYENLIVKVSYKLYWPSDSNASGVCPLQKESGTTEKFEAGYVPDESGEGFSLLYIMKYSGGQNVDKAVKNFPLAPYDTWVDISYTMDLQDNRLLSFSWDGYTTNFTKWALTNPNCNYFCSWGHADYDPAGENAKHGVDDLVIERIPRESAPKLSADAYVNGGTNDTFSVGLKNLGSGSLDYTAEIVDLDDALTIENPTGRVRDSVSLNVTLDRSKLDSNFYRARVRVDAGEAGCATSIVAFVVGNVYYFADFEEPFFLEGDITGQDEWENDWPEGNNAYVLTTNATQCLMIETGGGYGGYYHTLEVPRNSLMRFDMDFFVPPAIFEDPERLDQSILHLKQNSTYEPSIELMIAPSLGAGVPILVGTAMGEDYDLVLAEYAEDWMHLSYTIDYAEGQLVEFSIGDTVEHPEFVYTKDSDVPCTLFCICVGSQVNLQVDNVKVSVVPEPAVLGFLALLGLALIRRK
ncbi:BACON domain-containing protein, partial [bacterium]|nr:BACON domain-containing protein [bacterium]